MNAPSASLGLSCGQPQQPGDWSPVLREELGQETNRHTTAEGTPTVASGTVAVLIAAVLPSPAPPLGSCSSSHALCLPVILPVWHCLAVWLLTQLPCTELNDSEAPDVALLAPRLFQEISQPAWVDADIGR